MKYPWFAGFKYDKKKNIYNAIFKEEDYSSSWGITIYHDLMTIINEIIGLKQNVVFNSGLYDYDSSINKREQYYEIYGDPDKKIILEDIYDLFISINNKIKKENIFDDDIVELTSIMEDCVSSSKYNSEYALYWKKH